jgi:hypothetical protein
MTAVEETVENNDNEGIENIRGSFKAHDRRRRNR